MFDGIPFQYSKGFVIFFLFKLFNYIFTWPFYSFRYFLFSFFSLLDGTFFYVKFRSYILAVYSDCLNQNILFFFIFSNRLIFFMYIRWLIFF